MKTMLQIKGIFIFLVEGVKRWYKMCEHVGIVVES